MKNIILLIGLLFTLNCVAQQPARALKIVSFSGSGYNLGLQHGKELKNEIGEILTAWKQNTESTLGKKAEIVLNDFFEYAKFENDIKKWTPDLYEEVRGIADGSEQTFHDILVLNLLDEFWVYIDDISNHHCSAVGVPSKNGKPGYISQNMDLENFTDGFQVIMKLKRTENNPEQLILTYPGLIALNGLNENGIGVCVNTLMQLKASSSGLPVAFVIRRILNSSDKEDLLSFIQSVNHASGQNYLIGIKGEVFDFEASSNKVLRYNPMNENGTVYHTNHPIVNDDIKPWFKKYDPKLKNRKKPSKTNSFIRFAAVEKRFANNLKVDDVLIKEALRSRDNEKNPVCRSNTEKNNGFTFASVILTLADNPYIQITAGPPDESDYQRFDFSENE